MSQNTDRIEQMYQERNALDSLYMEHLKDCSMISNDEIAIDENGYLYSTYHKNY